MFEILKVIHMLSVGMVALAMSNAIIGAVSGRFEASVQPGFGAVAQIFGRIGRFGVLLFWITGLWMFFDRYGMDLGAMPVEFHWKLGFVVIATAIVVVMDYTPLRHRYEAVRTLGALAGVSFVIVVIFAVLTFN